jgi:hypothetical protein
MFSWFKVTYDFSITGVTRADLNAVIMNYHAMPGWGNYDNKMDFNLNYRIDICDMATVAANMYIHTYNGHSNPLLFSLKLNHLHDFFLVKVNSSILRYGHRR